MQSTTIFVTEVPYDTDKRKKHRYLLDTVIGNSLFAATDTGRIHHDRGVMAGSFHYEMVCPDHYDPGFALL